MCICTQYDSHCGHSWVSLTTPCGYHRDFLNCMERQIIEMCIAPPGTCPQCFDTFANRETIEMIQGPWGCNQMIRSHLDDAHVIPGHWGNAKLQPLHLERDQQMIPGDWGNANLQPLHVGGDQQMIPGGWGARPLIGNDWANQGDAILWDNGKRNNGKQRYKRDEYFHRKYRHKVSDRAGCLVM